VDESLVEGRDYYRDALGRLVYTEFFLRTRGYCCGLGCRHCPWGFTPEDREEEPGKAGEEQTQ
jgi:hypothetical protein